MRQIALNENFSEELKYCFNNVLNNLKDSGIGSSDTIAITLFSVMLDKNTVFKFTLHIDKVLKRRMYDVRNTGIILKYLSVSCDDGSGYSEQLFPLCRIDEAIDCFCERVNSDKPMMMTYKVDVNGNHVTNNFSLDSIEVFQSQELFFENVYTYLEYMVPEFRNVYFGESCTSYVFSSGLISAHGDKGYGYYSTFNENNINYCRGMLLFLLTYTKEMDLPKHKSCEWIVSNYQKYLPFILKAEQAVLKKHFQ